MKILAALFLAILACVAMQPVLGAPSATPAPGPSPSYDDPGMHFDPPQGYQRLEVPPVDFSTIQHLTTVAAYVRNRGHQDQLMITISVEPFEGSTVGWEGAAEQELRQVIDGALVSNKDQTRTTNGMPCFWLHVSFGEGFTSSQQYAYAVADGRRGIYAAISGLTGIIDEAKAKDALKGLAVVVYPVGR